MKRRSISTVRSLKENNHVKYNNFENEKNEKENLNKDLNEITFREKDII